MANNANTEIYDKIIDRAAMTRLYEQRTHKKVEYVLDGHVVRLDDLVKKSSLNTEGKKKLFAALDEEVGQTMRVVNEVSKKSLLDLAGDQISYTYQNIETAIGKIWRPERPSKKIAEEFILGMPLAKNKTMEQGWIGIGLSERLRLEQVIRKGIAEGSTVDEIALAIRKGNVTNITRQQSKALVTTATTSVVAQADHAVYKANEKSLAGWQYVSVLDSRTSSVCAARDGKIYRIDEKEMLPPAHFNCRSTTVPVFKNWKDVAELEGVANVRKQNIKDMTPDQLAKYDGQTALRESYNDWLRRQPVEVKLKHLGDYKRVELFNSGELTLDKFTNEKGYSVGINELRALTSGNGLPGDTRRFAAAKQRLDAMHLYATNVDDFIGDRTLTQTLRDYYRLQAGDLDGNLSLINYRGNLLHTKKATKARVLNSPPTEKQLIFNPVNGRYEDARMYQPSPAVFANSLKLVDDSADLLDRDKAFIKEFVTSLEDTMGDNERSAIAHNLRIVFGRQRADGQPWASFKGASTAQMKFDVMNVSEAMETHLRKDTDLLKKLKDANYIDPVLGPTQLQELHDGFISNILAKNKWEDSTAPKIARKLRGALDADIARSNPLVWASLGDSDLSSFYLRFANRLSLVDVPDFDQLAMQLGRDLFTAANIPGEKTAWIKLGQDILKSDNVKEFYKLETFGVQKRRMKSRMSGNYFGPYYDTLSYNIRIVEPRIQEYAKLTRKVELGLRVGVTTNKNKLYFRENSKTYWIDRGILGWEDTRIPITSTSSFSDFPTEFIDKEMVDALNWASDSKYKIDPEFFDFTNKLLNFRDDKGKAEFFDKLNEYKHYISSRGDAYERFKSMEWLRGKDIAFSNHAFIDHRARIYDRGLISPQSGETFRPFLSTQESHVLGRLGYDNLNDQIGSFLGGLSDELEGKFNSLTQTGRQAIARKWRSDMAEIGRRIRRNKPDDIRYILQHPLVQMVEGEEQGKFFRFALELAKIEDHTKGNLKLLDTYKTALALEQDASSSGAQIIAMTTRNKELASLSNVVPTTQKRRLYDEIANSTFHDPRFIKLNERLGLSEKDLRKAAKA